MTSKQAVVPYSLKDAPALIEKILPAQKLSAESYKEQMAVHGKTLTALGSYWKGRKPLILSKACVLGCLLPATGDLKRDLEVFEKLMAMDSESIAIRLGHIKPAEIIRRVALADLYQYFAVEPADGLPRSTPVDLEEYRLESGRLPRIRWREDLPGRERLRIEALALPPLSYRELVEAVDRPESCQGVHDHIWDDVNAHLGTDAHSFPELVEQLGIMRFGHRPRIADTFCGSGQIPFEAARLGCDVYASDLNPIACMLTWGAFNIVGGSPQSRETLAHAQKALVEKVQAEIDRLGVETDGNGWRAKVFLYCVEAKCPQTGWRVPLLPTRVVSKGYKVIAELVPDPVNKRYDIVIRSGVTEKELTEAEKGTVRSDGRGQDPYMIHTVKGIEYRTRISTLRGDYRKEDGSTGNRLRLWEKRDIIPRPDDIFQERLYAIQWSCIRQHPRTGKSREVFEFRSVTDNDLMRESLAQEYVSSNLLEWQDRGWVPDLRIEPGDKTSEPIRTRGWTYWHHLFNPRQLMLGALLRQADSLDAPFILGQVLNVNSRCTRWNPSPGPGRAGATSTVFDNQAINTLFNYACRATAALTSFLPVEYKSFPIDHRVRLMVECIPADQCSFESDICITDPPYGDAVKYEEILEFFIAWLRKNPPKEFSSWTWDSRRSLAIKGEGEDFRRGMVAAYKRMAEKMPDNGIQVVMFTHQSGDIWADMASIVWASGLQVTAAWYVATETDSALREGSYVKGTVLLVLRKRKGDLRTTRDDLAWEIQEEVEKQVSTLVGLNQETRGLHRDENLFEDADLQMAGYAASLRVLTQYSIIDGKDMASEALRPRVKGEKTFVDDLIDFAVNVANQCLVPEGIKRATWDDLEPAERFYLKMVQLEARGLEALDNYQNFAKAFKVRDFRPFMASCKANQARLKSAQELGRTEMTGESELAGTALRGVLYALMELEQGTDGSEVLTHLPFNVPDYYSQRSLILEISQYLAGKLSTMRPEEASAARVLAELVRNQRV